MKQIFFEVKRLYARYFATKGGIMFAFLTAFTLIISPVHADEAQDLKTIEQLLNSGQGVEGSMHAVAVEQNLYVFSYTGVTGFFEQVRLSLAPRKKEAFDILKTLSRHDRVRVFGSLDMNNGQPHIRLTDIQLLKSWGSPFPEYKHEVKLPKDLEKMDSFIGKVHAVHANGAVVVLEYKDSVLPLIVKKDELDLTKNLFRGDKVKVFFDIAGVPSRPTHLELKKMADAIVALNPIRMQHGVIHEFEGSLVMFPQSPQIKFNVFALQSEIGDGVVLDYTLIPKSFDSVVFEQLRNTLQAAWDKSPEAAVNGRNKWIKKSIRIKAKGTINVIDPNQANPQIFFEDLKDVQIL